jgi:iron complex outermembrane receptor protein
VKRTGPRYVYDTNEPVQQIVAFTAATSPTGVAGTRTIQVFGNKVPAYTLVDFNARVPLGWAGLNDKTYFQLNVLNAFDKLWVSSLNSGNGALNQGPTFSGTGAVTAYGSAPNSQIGYPRTFMGSLVVGF